MGTALVCRAYGDKPPNIRYPPPGYNGTILRGCYYVGGGAKLTQKHVLERERKSDLAQ